MKIRQGGGTGGGTGGVDGVIRLTRSSQHNETIHSVQTYFIYLTAISMGQTRFGLAQE